MNVFDLCGPDPIPMACNEVTALIELVHVCMDDVRTNRSPIVVQIGADQGISTCAIVTARRDATVFSIDKGRCEREFDNLARCELDGHKVVRLLGRSALIGNSWPEIYEIDFLFIDGDHSELGVRLDIGAWVPHVRNGGIVAFHDYIPPPIPANIKGRVYAAVDDLMAGYPQIRRTNRLIAFSKKGQR